MTDWQNCIETVGQRQLEQNNGNWDFAWFSGMKWLLGFMFENKYMAREHNWMDTRIFYIIDRDARGWS